MAFPDTRQSTLLRLRNGDESVRRQSWEAIIAAYWSPVQAYLRKRWNQSEEDAADLTQAFFLSALEKGTLVSYDPARAAFRTYLRTCLDRFAINFRKRDRRRPTAAPIDFDLPGPAESPDAVFEREWIRGLFSLAVEDLRNLHDDIRFRVFLAYDLNESEVRPTYAELAMRFGITTETITNYLAAMRRQFRKTLLTRLRELTATEREFRSEARAILGVDV
jgi:RNA polymerase sigma factor (sigma-70 family)